MFKSPDRRQSGSLVSEYSPSSEQAGVSGEEVRQAAGRQGTGRCTRAGHLTREETRRRGQEQKAGQVPGDPSREKCWKVVHDVTTLQQKESVEELVERRLSESNDLD